MPLAAQLHVKRPVQRACLVDNCLDPGNRGVVKRRLLYLGEEFRDLLYDKVRLQEGCAVVVA